MAFDNFEVVAAAKALADYASKPNPTLPTMQLSSLLNSYHQPVRTAIVEKNYVDVDYSASYHDQHGRSFTPGERSTTRIHFFAEDFKKSDLIDATESVVQSMAQAYQGYAVVRPDRDATLGRTFISCPSSLLSDPARFPTRGTTAVDLAGIPLEIESCPYMSQDQKIMACATAALWMSTTPLVEKIPGVATHTTAEITSLGMSINRPFGPSVGRRGLTPQEMEQALLQIGFDPRTHSLPQPEDLVETCHLFSDSGIPPILIINFFGYGRHAVTVVGYTLKSTSNISGLSQGASSAHKFVSNLIIHDDQRGMYLPIEVSQGQVDSRDVTILTIPEGGQSSTAICESILIPFPRRLMLDSQEVTGKAEELIAYAKAQNWIENRDVIYRTLLVRSNTLKQTLLKRQDTWVEDNGYPKDLVSFTRSLPMPRYVWLIEVSYQKDWDPGDPNSPLVVADFILDSTSTEITRPDYLMFHVQGHVVGVRVAGNHAERVNQEVLDDYPHPPFPNVPRP